MSFSLERTSEWGKKVAVRPQFAEARSMYDGLGAVSEQYSLHKKIIF